jgi:hypothetical protein
VRERLSQGIARHVTTMLWAMPMLLPLAAATVALSLSSAESSDFDDVRWALLAIPGLALIGACARTACLTAHGERGRSAWWGALGAAAIGVGFAYVVWYGAWVNTCHGRYECPF